MIGEGGGFGSLVCYLVGAEIRARFGSRFLRAINVAGSFLIGLQMTVRNERV